MTTAQPVRPVWIAETDEAPHAPVEMPQWSENYLSYVYSPESGVGIWFHFSHVPENGRPGLWEEVLYCTLPGDRRLVARTHAPGRTPDGAAAGGLTVSGLTFRCHEPFRRWTKHFVGGARLVGAEELQAGPLGDGAHTPVHLDLECTMMSPPFDYGTGSLDQSWGKAHYEQHQEVRGTLRVGDETFAIDGAGMRDHSWGPRDWTKMGRTTWIHAQFPNSGRSFMTVYVAERPPHIPDPLHYTVISDRDSVTNVEVRELPEAFNLTQCEQDAEFVIVTPDGSESRVRTQVLAPMRMFLVGDREFALGTTHRRGIPVPSHDYVPAFARVEWDGEVGYGYVERTAELL